MFLIGLFIFVIGLFVGSFLNVLADRLPRGESVIKGRSHCGSCKKTLKWYDLIPIFSFVQLRAKCRYCRTPLSYYYPLVELVTGVVFVAVLFFVGGSNINSTTIINIIYYLFIVSSLIIIFFVDLKYGIIPDIITFFAILVSIFFLLFTSKESWFLRQMADQPATFEVGFVNHLLSAVGSFLFFLAIFLVTRGRGMGFGDVKFAFLIGLILGFPKIIAGLYLAFLTGAVVSIILIIAKKKKFKGSTIPFGPFLAIGTFLALFWGEAIIKKVYPFL